MPKEFARLIGGRIGPVAPDADWSLSNLLETSPSIGHAGARRLLAQVGDPRDARALATMAELAMTTPGLGNPDEACRFITASFGMAARVASVAEDDATPHSFEERLFACDADGLGLLGRGEALAEGCRVLAVGGAGSGKTTYIAALADAIARASGRAVVRVEPAYLLARSWGSTEGLVLDLWRRARAEHHVLLADEVDSICARREADASTSGNGYLVRCLTNELLRQLDAHPDVPFLASTNAEAACDAAFLRRVTAVVYMADVLSPDQELVAWERVLHARPPDGWTPTGCAVADYAAALARCRLLGHGDPEALAAALHAARRARSGRPATPPTDRPRRKPLH